MRSGPSSSRIFTAAGLHRPSPALSVSCRWRTTSSSSLRSASLADGELNASSFFASTSTRPAASRVFVVTVPPVRKRWGSKVVKSLKAGGFTPQMIPMPDGEPSKRLATVEALADRLARLGADRKAVIIALGGGVVGDVGGLLASLYMRGI